MDYYVFITRTCNLSCSYCCFSENLTKEFAREPTLDVGRTVDYILRHAHNANQDKVFFYGGEPTLNEPWIREFVRRTEGKLQYVLQTNGIKLRDLAPDLVGKIHHLVVSIDGGREVNDALRGQGSYDLVLKNLEEIGDQYQGTLAARMTYTPGNPLASSVQLMLEKLGFHLVYWMHEDSVTPVTDWRTTRERYADELAALVEYWMRGLRAGRVRGIIPFKAIMSSLLDPPTPPSAPRFRCGVGSFLRVIDIDGTVYPCDLMITADRRHAVGHIDDTKESPLLPRNDVYNRTCARCDDLPYCGGRCFNLSFHDDERVGEFCARTKLLIDHLRGVLPEVRQLIAEGTICQDDIPIETTLTEQIP